MNSLMRRQPQRKNIEGLFREMKKLRSYLRSSKFRGDLKKIDLKKVPAIEKHIKKIFQVMADDPILNRSVYDLNSDIIEEIIAELRGWDSRLLKEKQAEEAYELYVKQLKENVRVARIFREEVIEQMRRVIDVRIKVLESVRLSEAERKELQDLQDLLHRIDKMRTELHRKKQELLKVKERLKIERSKNKEQLIDRVRERFEELDFYQEDEFRWLIQSAEDFSVSYQRETGCSDAKRIRVFGKKFTEICDAEVKKKGLNDNGRILHIGDEFDQTMDQDISQDEKLDSMLDAIKVLDEDLRTAQDSASNAIGSLLTGKKRTRKSFDELINSSFSEKSTPSRLTLGEILEMDVDDLDVGSLLSRIDGPQETPDLEESVASSPTSIPISDEDIEDLDIDDLLQEEAPSTIPTDEKTKQVVTDSASTDTDIEDLDIDDLLERADAKANLLDDYGKTVMKEVDRKSRDLNSDIVDIDIDALLATLDPDDDLRPPSPPSNAP